MRLSFRRLVDDDLPTLHRWLNEPGVVTWWEGEDVSWEAVVDDYSAAATDSAEHWIAAADGRDIGWLDCYPVGDYPEESVPWSAVGVDASDTAGIDYLLGDPQDRGRGLGPSMIDAFVEEIVFGRHPRWSRAAAAPHVDNVPSWRALEKVGFRFVDIVEDQHGPGRLMVRDRPSPTVSGSSNTGR